jgi:hypothetical protein
MPYFQRKPYAQTPQQVPSAGAAADLAAGLAEAPDILQIASGVLSEQPLPAATGPFRLRQPIRAGQSGTMVLTLWNDGGAESVVTRLVAGDLLGPGGRIPAAQVRVEPAAVSLSAGSACDVRVTVTASPGTMPGLYLGQLQGDGVSGIAIPVEVPVLA